MAPAYRTRMTNSLASVVVGVPPQQALERTGNVLSNTLRQLGQMVDGHETLLLVILALLVLMYLYLRKA